MKTEYVIILEDDCYDHVMSQSEKSFRSATKFVTFLRKENPDGHFIIAKTVARLSPPRRWRLS